MNKIDEIRDKKADESAFDSGIHYGSGEFSARNKHFKAGFDAAMELQLPVLFAEWKDKNCSYISDGYYFNQNGFSNIAYTLKDLYAQWLTDIYSPEKIIK